MDTQRPATDEGGAIPFRQIGLEMETRT
jgi:hypothetical protein